MIMLNLTHVLKRLFQPESSLELEASSTTIVEKGGRFIFICLSYFTHD